MNLKALAVLCLILALVLTESDGWRRRRRRRRRTCRRQCSNYGCSHGCQWVNGVAQCSYYCRPSSCSWSCSGKRDESEKEVQADERKKSPSHASGPKYVSRVPLTNKFSDYDKNKDGRIDFNEFKTTLPPVSSDKQIQEGFDMIDKNGDRHIDCAEFLRAKMDFVGHKKPTCK